MPCYSASRGSTGSPISARLFYSSQCRPLPASSPRAAPHPSIPWKRCVTNRSRLMRKLRATWLRLRGYFRSQSADDDFAAELESHIALHIDESIRAGLSREEARRQALIRLGGAEQTRQQHRERRTLPWLESLMQDTHYGLRTMANNAGFTTVAVLT